MLRFMPAKLVHETHRCKFVGQTANYGDIRLCVWTKCKDLGRMTKQKSADLSYCKSNVFITTRKI